MFVNKRRSLIMEISDEKKKFYIKVGLSNTKQI